MKRIFTLLSALIVVGAMNIEAQQLQQSWIDGSSLSREASRVIEVGDNQAWWGYVDNSGELSGLGVQSADTYHCAIFIPGDHPIAAGKRISAVRFALGAPHAADARIWAAATLPATISKATTLALTDVSDAELGSQNIEVAFDTPVDVPAEGIYVGYSFTITAASGNDDKFPVMLTGNAQPNALLLRTETAVKSWGDLYSYGYGSLFLQVLLEGEFQNDIAAPSDIADVYTLVGGQAKGTFTVTNLGLTPVTSIDYTVGDGTEQHADLSKAIAFGEKTTAGFAVEAEGQQGLSKKTLTITKVNGVENSTAAKSATFSLYTLNELIGRNVVVEEFTGTGCGWCPRGIAGMEKINKTFGDRVVAIGIHQYNSSDAMYIATNAYARLSFSGAPSCQVNRTGEVDPYYGSDGDICDDIRPQLEVPATVKVEVSGTWNADQSAVDAKATVTSLIEGDDYTLEFVLIGDGLKGTGSAWTQQNYYTQYATSQLPKDLAQFGNGGKYGTASISGWTFNDVALKSSYVSGKNQVAALTGMTPDTPKEVSYTLALPTKATLLEAIQKDKVYVAALLVGADGTVVNAAKAAVKAPAPTGISTTAATSATATAARYGADGRLLSAPQKGLNIVRLADGTVRKVMVK